MHTTTVASMSFKTNQGNAVTLYEASHTITKDLKRALPKCCKLSSVWCEGPDEEYIQVNRVHVRERKYRKHQQRIDEVLTKVQERHPNEAKQTNFVIGQTNIYNK